MTKSEIMLAAHAEARAIVIAKRCSYQEAMSFGLRRVYNKIMTEQFVVTHLTKPKTPKFMWLRGM